MAGVWGVTDDLQSHDSSPSSNPLAENRWAPTDTSQFHGPQFVCNLEGLALEVKHDKVRAAKFHGERSQQWLFQPDPFGMGKICLVSLLSGTYLDITPSTDDSVVRVAKTAFYWDVTRKGDVYRLGNGSDYFALPLSHGKGCTMNTPTSLPEEDASTSLLLLEDSPQVRKALEQGNIGQWGYPEQSIYYTTGEAGQIRVYNHLDSAIYAAVSTSGQVASTWTAGQWTIKANNWQFWNRTSDESVHASLSDCVGAQTAQVFQGRVGKVLHIQSLPSSSEWQGIKSVLPSDATYAANASPNANSIGIKNNLSFTIYATVLNSWQGSGESIGPWPMSPGKTSFWQRQGPEIVLVSIGSAPGVPQAFLGKVGFTLHIDEL